MPADPPPVPTRPPVPLDRIEAAADAVIAETSASPEWGEAPMWSDPERADEGYNVWHVGDGPLFTLADHMEEREARHVALCDPPTIKALTAALRRQDAALERIAWALDGDDPVVIACDAMAEVRAAVSFSPTGGAEDEA